MIITNFDNLIQSGDAEAASEHIRMSREALKWSNKCHFKVWSPTLSLSALSIVEKNTYDMFFRSSEAHVYVGAECWSYQFVKEGTRTICLWPCMTISSASSASPSSSRPETIENSLNIWKQPMECLFPPTLKSTNQLWAPGTQYILSTYSFLSRIQLASTVVL